MAVRRRLVCAAMATMLAVVGSGLLAAQSAAAANGAKKPVITALTATPPKVTAVGGSTTISATVQGAASCKVEALPALLGGSGTLPCAAGTLTDALLFPTNALPITYLIIVTAKGPSGAASSATIKVKVRAGAGGGLAGVQATASDAEGSCALLAPNGQVDCWGYDTNGQLGDGQLDTSSPFGSAIPAPVQGVNGTGTLVGVASLFGDNSDGYCALLDSSELDCWGFGQAGGLGDGQFADSALPVPVQDVSGDGVLSGVASVTGDGLSTCALLTSGGVDCWGYGPNGELGNGEFYASSPFGSATPVQVSDTAGDGGLLSGVASLTGGQDGYCAMLADGGVDCWGDGTSALPVPVPDLAVDGGTLAGVSSLMSDSTGGYCAVLTTSGVDCWGTGTSGELGDGQFSSSGSPVQVEGVAGSGVLLGVSNVTSDQDGYCALLAAGGVDCWGNGTYGILGNGQFSNSATPVQVEGVSGSGVLHKATSLTGDGNGFCVVQQSAPALISCWGEGGDGALGNGRYYAGAGGSATPVQVEGVGATGTLSGVASLMGAGDGYCAVLTTSQVDCWGYGPDGELGNGQYYSSPDGSAVPVEVL